MGRLILLEITLLLSASLFSHATGVAQTPPKTEGHPKQHLQPVVENEENIVRNLVEDFGKKLQMVSLSAPLDIVSRSMQEN